MTPVSNTSVSRWYVCTGCGFFWATHGDSTEVACEHCDRFRTLLICDHGFEAHELGREWFKGPGG